MLHMDYMIYFYYQFLFTQTLTKMAVPRTAMLAITLSEA